MLLAAGELDDDVAEDLSQDTGVPTLVVLPETLPVSVVVVTPLGVASHVDWFVPRAGVDEEVRQAGGRVGEFTVVVAPSLLTLTVTTVLLAKLIGSNELRPAVVDLIGLGRADDRAIDDFDGRARRGRVKINVGEGTVSSPARDSRR